MYLLVFSLLLLFSALNLKAQKAGGMDGEMVPMVPDTGVAPVRFFSFSLASDLLNAIGRSSDGGGERPKALLSDRESLFFEPLRGAMGRVNCTVMTKVNLENVVRGRDLCREVRTKFDKAINKMGRKHVDFVVCGGSALDILAIVQLHPTPGIRPLQKLMERRIDGILASTGIPVVQFPPSVEYTEDEILGALMPYVA